MDDFNAEKCCNEIVKFIRNYYQKNDLKGAVVGISGGKDSAVVAALMCKALGSENVIGVTLPCYSKKEDSIDAKLISDYYHFKLLNFDITPVFDTFKVELKNIGIFNDIETKNSDINLKPRLRMSVLYYLAALYTFLEKKTYLVIGTSNKCELFVGYFTKGGDSVYDIAPIADLTVEEVIEIGKYLNVPKKVLYKKPNDGLTGQTDEEKLGFKYSEVAMYMENNKDLDEHVAEKIRKAHEKSLHKFNIPIYRKSKNMRIGIFGGCFNPPHNMHKKIGLELIEKGYADKIIYVPTGDKYQKNNLIPAKNRYEMLTLMTKDSKNLFVSDYEINDHLMCTYQTLSYFNKKYPQDEIYFICGSDNLLDFDTWNNYQYILEKYKILVIRRGDTKVDDILKNNKNIIEVNISFSNLSSTEIRKLIKLHGTRKLSTKLDERVIKYIEENNLYN